MLHVVQHFVKKKKSVPCCRRRFCRSPGETPGLMNHRVSPATLMLDATGRRRMPEGVGAQQVRQRPIPGASTPVTIDPYGRCTLRPDTPLPLH
jgi:hypothetical protein